MLKCECNEKHARLECEPLPNGLTLVRVYEDEQEVTREAVSNMDTPWHGYSYTTYGAGDACAVGLPRGHTGRAGSAG